MDDVIKMVELLSGVAWEPRKTFVLNNIDFVVFSIKEYSAACVVVSCGNYSNSFFSFLVTAGKEYEEE